MYLNTYPVIGTNTVYWLTVTLDVFKLFMLQI